VADEELVALVLRETGRAYVGMGRFADAGPYLDDARDRLTTLGLTEELAPLEAAAAACRQGGSQVTAEPAAVMT
jgi:hypothetical protein